MSIDTTFKPISAPVALISGTPVQVNGFLGVTTFRITNTAAAVARVSWGKTSAQAPTPAVATPIINSVLLLAGENLYLEVPGDSFFNASAAATIEIIGGIGGVGG
jgi:hypothetical protein